DVMKRLELHALDGQRRPIVRALGHDVCTHLPQGIEDAFHWPLRERRVADQPAAERLAREESGQEAHGGARVPAVEVALRRCENALLSVHDERGLVWRLDLDAECAHRGDGAEAILARQKTAKHTGSIAHGSEHHRAVRDALVARHCDLRANRRRAADFPIRHRLSWDAGGRAGPWLW